MYIDKPKPKAGMLVGACDTAVVVNKTGGMVHTILQQESCVMSCSLEIAQFVLCKGEVVIHQSQIH